jgi:hypothetical protein
MEAILVHMDMELMTIVILIKVTLMYIIISMEPALAMTTLIIKQKNLTKIILIITIITNKKNKLLI